MMNSQQPTVFLVDDDDAIRKALSVALRVRGRSVLAYETAEGFLAAYAQQPGCLVLDIRLPGMSGLELQSVLSLRRCSLPIIFVTGHGDSDMSAQAIRSGAFGFLEKPFKQEELLGRIDEALEQNAG